MQCGIKGRTQAMEEGTTMEEEKKQGLSRRAFLGLGGTAIAGAAVAGVAGCAPQNAGDATKASTAGAADGAAGGKGGMR